MSFKALRMVHNKDPKNEIMEAVKPYLDQIEPTASQVLCAIYTRPGKTVSGIYLPDKSKEEDTWQGKVGLVVKMGPLAFVDDDSHNWGPGRRPRVGDWVMWRVGDTFRFVMGERQLRLVEDVNIKAILGKPDIVL